MGGGSRMKCKSVRCKREIPENSIFCPWCGFRQIAEANERKAAAEARINAVKK